MSCLRLQTNFYKLCKLDLVHWMDSNYRQIRFVPVHKIYHKFDRATPLNSSGFTGGHKGQNRPRLLYSQTVVQHIIQYLIFTFL